MNSNKDTQLIWEAYLNKQQAKPPPHAATASPAVPAAPAASASPAQPGAAPVWKHLSGQEELPPLQTAQPGSPEYVPMTDQEEKTAALAKAGTPEANYWKARAQADLEHVTVTGKAKVAASDANMQNAMTQVDRDKQERAGMMKYFNSLTPDDYRAHALAGTSPKWDANNPEYLKFHPEEVPPPL